MTESLHTASRVFAGVTVLLTAAMNQSLAIAFAQLLIVSLALLWPMQCALMLKRSYTLLVWLVLPILVMHMLFTPGEMLLPGYPLPVTKEGLWSGIWFSLHISVIFIAAVMLSNLLSRHEWTRMIISIPYLGSRLLPYIIMSGTAEESVRSITRKSVSAWREKGAGLAGLAGYLVRLPVAVLAHSNEFAISVWEQWDNHVEKLQQADSRNRSVPEVISIVIFGVAVWILYFSHDMWQ